MGSWNWPALVNKISTDIPFISAALKALLKLDPTGIDDVPVDAKRLTETAVGQHQFQKFSGTAWSSVGKLMHDVDTVDGYHASQTANANTIAVRDANGKLAGDILGNSATATSAIALSVTCPIAKGGTGATSSAAARVNLDTPPTAHKSTATTYGVGDVDEYGHIKLSDAIDSASDASGGVAATPSAVKTAYDRASLGVTNAATAQATATQALGKAEEAVANMTKALSAPIVSMAEQIATGLQATVTLAAPTIMLPSATVAAFQVCVDGGSAQTVTAANNAGTFTFTPAGAAGSTVTLTVTATDNLGNTSPLATKSASVVDAYVIAPSIISPTAGAEVTYSSIAAVTSAFSAFGVADTHASTDWRITADEAGDTVISTELASSDLISHTFPAIALEQAATRYLWARHNGTTLGASAWGKVAVTVKPTRHGEILYDTSGNPAAVIIGSYASNGAKPWVIRGKSVWLAVALASKRGVSTPWGADTTSSSTTNSTDITTIENPTTSWKMASNNTAADGSEQYVSNLTTEAHMDGSFTYTQTVKDSKGLTNAILAYNSGMQAAAFCRAINLADDLGTMDLPSIDALMRIYQARTVIDALDPTAASNPAKKLSAWGFGSAFGPYVWSASEYASTYAWYVTSNGYTSYGSKYRQFGVCPVLEIPA